MTDDLIDQLKSDTAGKVRMTDSMRATLGCLVACIFVQGGNMHAEQRIAKYADVGQWTISKSDNHCIAKTHFGLEEITLFLMKHPIMSIRSSKFKIPTGQYKVGIESSHDGHTYSIMKDCTILPKDPDTIYFHFHKIKDLKKIASYDWIKFDIGGGTHYFNMAAGSIIDIMQTCNNGGVDPFVTAR